MSEYSLSLTINSLPTDEILAITVFDKLVNTL